MAFQKISNINLYNSYENLLVLDFLCALFFFIEFFIILWAKGISQYFNEIIDIFDSIVIIS